MLLPAEEVELIDWGQQRRFNMAKKPTPVDEVRIERPKRANLTAHESLKRMQRFSRRKEKFIASIRKGKN